MTLPNFGIPDEAAHLDVLREQTAINSQHLNTIARALGERMFDTLASNENKLGGIWKKLRQSLQGRASGNRYHLEQVEKPLINTLANAIAQHAALLHGVQAAQAMPHANVSPDIYYVYSGPNGL